MTLILRVECDDLLVNEVINKNVNLLQKIKRITELMNPDETKIILIIVHEQNQYTINMNFQL